MPPKSSWTLYVVLCSDGSLYCGITTNLIRRLRQHNGELVGGAKYTRGRRPVILQASKDCPSKGDALRAELRFKRLSPSNKRKDFKTWT
jgi:putative endonuclease